MKTATLMKTKKTEPKHSTGPNFEICSKCERLFTHETPESVHQFCMKKNLNPDTSEFMGTIHKDGQFFFSRFRLPSDCPYTLEHVVAERKHTADSLARIGEARAIQNMRNRINGTV